MKNMMILLIMTCLITLGIATNTEARHFPAPNFKSEINKTKQLSKPNTVKNRFRYGCIRYSNISFSKSFCNQQHRYH